MEQKMLVGWFSDYRVILGTQMERHFFFTDGRTQSHSYSPFRPHEYCTTVKHIEQLISNNIVTCYFDHIIKVYLCSGSAGPTLHCMVGCPEFWCWRPLLEPSVRRRGGERDTYPISDNLHTFTSDSRHQTRLLVAQNSFYICESGWSAGDPLFRY